MRSMKTSRSSGFRVSDALHALVDHRGNEHATEGSRDETPLPSGGCAAFEDTRTPLEVALSVTTNERGRSSDHLVAAP